MELAVLTPRLILAIMILPFITAISRDVFETVPPVLKEAAYGVGCTTWEVVRNVVIPYTRVGVIGGVMLALGRALGETMAVTFIIGNAFKIRARSSQPGTTISAASPANSPKAAGCTSRPDPARPAAVRAHLHRARRARLMLMR
jgi:phosphate transport system permease protein